MIGSPGPPTGVQQQHELDEAVAHRRTSGLHEVDVVASDTAHPGPQLAIRELLHGGRRRLDPETVAQRCGELPAGPPGDDPQGHRSVPWKP